MLDGHFLFSVGKRVAIAAKPDLLFRNVALAFMKMGCKDSGSSDHGRNRLCFENHFQFDEVLVGRPGKISNYALWEPI